MGVRQFVGVGAVSDFRMRDAAADRERVRDRCALVDAVLVAVAIGLLLAALIGWAGVTLV